MVRLEKEFPIPNLPFSVPHRSSSVLYMLLMYIVNDIRYILRF